MSFYFCYLLLYYVLIGISKNIFNNTNTVAIAIIYLLVLIILIHVKRSIKLLKLNAFRFNTKSLIVLIIPLFNIITTLVNGFAFNINEMIIVVISGIIEELLFRVVIYESLKFTTNTKILITNVLFSLIHLLNILGNYQSNYVLIQVMFSFSIGIYLSVIYIKSNSILPCIIIHTLINVTSLGVYNNKGLLLYLLISIIFLIIDINYLRKNKNETLY